MSRAVADADTVLSGERYDSLADFYSADERRLRSRELDVGLWWREHEHGPLHRAAWVLDTGELYLAHLGARAEGGGEVELLARLVNRERLEMVLAGWRERCGGPDSLVWLRERCALLVVSDGSRRGAGAASREPLCRRRGPRGERALPHWAATGYVAELTSRSP